MAEAAIDVTNNMSQLRYYCHQCSQETTSVLPDYKCPRCQSGFIEEVNQEEPDQSSNQEPQLSDILDNFYNLDNFSGSSIDESHRSSGYSNGPNGSHSFGGMDEQNERSGDGSQPRTRHMAGNGANPDSPEARHRTRYYQFNIPRTADGVGLDNQQSLEGLFQHILTNVASGQFGAREGGIGVGGRGLINIDFPLPLFQVLHGNPGDYAWGQGGLDTIISQLLNQLDGTGPPPMPKEEVERLPFVSITEEQVSKNLQCTICMEDYKLAEKVRLLSCSHCYHNDCIIPWLQMHATCPVCRKELTPNRIPNQGLTNRGSVQSNSYSDSQQPSDSTPTNQTSHANSYQSSDDYD